MSDKRVCDICGMVEGSLNKGGYPVPIYRFSREIKGSIFHFGETEQFDICKECYAEIRRRMKGDDKE